MKITTEIIDKHGIKPTEYKKIVNLIVKEPNLLELGIFSAMWNEHCSYKSSKKYLRTLPRCRNRGRRNTKRYFHNGSSAYRYA